MKRLLLIVLISFLYLPVFSQNSWGISNDIEEEENVSLKVYPNPCKTDKVTIDFGDNEIKEIRLCNITGKQVLLKKYYAPEHKIQLKLDELPNGIYLIQVKSDLKKPTVKKLVVSKN